MSNDELLKPRYKVIADFPQWSAFKHNKGDILFLKGIHFVGSGTSKSINEKEIVLYPHLFKKLEWWEERELSDMPDYVKLIFNDKISFVHKVHKWKSERNSDGQPLYHYYNLVDAMSTGCVVDLEPATKEEYDAYRQTKS